MSVVRLDRVSKRYADAVALNDVSLSLTGGEVIGLIGPNGAGKTTLMRVILGLVRPTGGVATVLGGAPGSREVLERVGSSIEAPAFIPSLSGRDNLIAAALAKGLDAKEVGRCLAAVGLEDAGGRKFRVYSMGMKQRLALARALLGDPELLVIDEPMNGLDPLGVVEMRALIEELASEGRTILISSHQLREVGVICTQIVVLNRGHIRATGTLDELGGDDLEATFFSLLADDDQEVSAR